jgi:hypothetical protein
VRIIALLKLDADTPPVQMALSYRLPATFGDNQVERAKDRYERCGKPNGREIQHLGDGPGAMDADGLYPALLELATT